jgi:hypothetical protein
LFGGCRFFIQTPLRGFFVWIINATESLNTRIKIIIMIVHKDGTIQGQLKGFQ